MSLTTPSAAPVVPTMNAGVIPVNYRPVSDITSFTYRTGMTHMALVENMRVWIQKSLIPFLNDNFSGMEEAWEIEVNTLIAAVNSALVEQTSDNTQKITEALDAIANADIAITDPAIMAVINTADSAFRTWLNANYGSGALVTPDAVLDAYNAADSVLKVQLGEDYDASGSAQAIRDEFARILAFNALMAPAPIGGGTEDTTALMEVISAAHATGATVYLQRGTYVANLNLAAQFAQVKIIGTGMRGTVIKSADKTKPTVKFNGGSGAFGGGGLYECGLTSADGAVSEGLALVFSGTTGCSARGVRISGSYSEGVRFWNERGANAIGDFTEFNTFEGDISGCVTPVRYQVDNGVESFHGSGLVGNTTINLVDATQYVVYVDKNGLPYNAPLSFTVWFRSTGPTNAHLIHMGNQGRSSGRHISFYGTIRVEGHPNSTDTPMGVCDGGTAAVLYQGGIMWLGAGTMTLGAINLCSKIGYEGGIVWGESLPQSFRAPLKNTPTNIAVGFEGGSIALVAVTISAPNYEFHAVLAVQKSRFNGAQAFITEITRTQDLDTNGKGDPVFNYNNALQASNPNFDSTFTAWTTVTNLGGGAGHQMLAQNALS